MKVRRWILAGFTLAVLWLFVRGVHFTPVHVVQELLVGLVFGFGVAGVFRRLYPGRTDLVRVAKATPYTLLYSAAFLYDLLTANVDVARRVLAPSMPIEPRVIKVPLRVETPFAITTIANSITLTPGTLSMDYDDETNTLYVHAIDGREPDAVVDPIRRWEDYALVIFDEERKPGDPVPRPGKSDSGYGGEGDE
ncbi:Na+/H+ antiporter subunit E [Halobacterium wangiae]|uniref:Na+/H+ antiporter subunit E n=1 Tax=Halobacterium wangiae TaxID=2902623 RepID=UPI001E5F0F9C|nr:Na+/H+ antiporter subunit E [Halobacterium wangiae]